MKKAAYFVAVFMLFAFVRIPILAEEPSQTEASTDQQKSEQSATETQTAETKAAESGRSESKPAQEKDSAKPAKTESARSASLMASGMPSSGTAANALQNPLSGMASGGAFVYTYPIEVPAGTNGMTPALALSYNSQSGNGMLGMGFSLSGLSAITRDSTYPITFSDSLDHFLLDGERLIPVAGQPGMYRTEREGFLRIKANTNGSLITSWEVGDKSGRKRTYGATPDSYIDAEGYSGKARVWALCKVEDVHGNGYSVEYAEESGAYYPARIWYGHIQQPSGLMVFDGREIGFTYQSRYDHVIKYSPTYVDETQILTSIQVHIGGVLQYTYAFDFEMASITARNRLLAIRRTGHVPVTIEMPGTTFEYTDQAGWSDYNSPYEVPFYGAGYNSDSQLPTFTGDWNGDGRTDIGRAWNGGLNFYYSNGSGFTFHSQLNDMSYTQGCTDTNGYPLYIGDWNGDGRTDMGRVMPDRVKFYIITDGGWVEYDGATIPFCPINGFTPNSLLPIVTGDWNGDGRTDIGRAWNGGFSFYYSNGSGFTFHSQIFDLSYNQGCTDTNAYPLYIGDWNGDGKTDMGRVMPDRVKFYTVRDSTWDEYYGANIPFHPSNGFPSNSIHPTFSGDWNGDGKTDIGRVWNGGLAFYISTGSGWQNYGTFPALGYGHGYTSSSMFPLFTGDWNGDGRTDVARVWNGGIIFYVACWSGWNAYSEGVNGLGVSNGYTDCDSYPLFIGDWNGDGRTDVGRVGSNSVVFKKNLENNSDLVRFVTNQSSGSISVTYTPLSQISGAAVSTSTYPVVANTAPVSLVTSIMRSDGFSSSPSTLTYEYRNGKVYSGLPHERANLGFEWVQETVVTEKDGNGNPVRGISTRSYYIQQKPYQGTVWKTESIGTDGLVYERVETEYGAKEIQPASGEHHAVSFVFPKNVRRTVFATGSDPSSAVTYRTQLYADGDPALSQYATWYDGYGNNIRSIDHGDVSVAGDEKAVRSWFTTPGPGEPYMVLPSLVRSYGCDLSGGGFDIESTSGLALETRFYYYPDAGTDISVPALGAGSSGARGLLARTERENGGQDWVERYAYDGYGNRTVVRNARGFDTVTTYDPVYHTLPLTVRDGLLTAFGVTDRFTSTVAYDALMRAVSVTDLYGSVWRTGYDAFSRVIRTVSPGDTEESPTTRTTYSDTTSPESLPRWVKQERKDGSADGYLMSYTFFDGLGRPIQTKSESETPGSWIAVKIWYDAAGRAYKTSMPYEVGGSQFDGAEYTNPASSWTTKEFDSAGRLSRVINPDGLATVYQYRKNAVLTMDVGEHITAQAVVGAEHSAYTFTAGSSFASIDNLDTWDYTKITTRTARDGVRITQNDNPATTVTVLTDMLGRKTRYSDPDMGTWLYGYDQAGNLTSQTDAKGQTIYFSYDERDRVELKDLPAGGDTDYVFDRDPASANFGRLTGVSYAGGSESYSYDNRGRIASVTKYIGGRSRSMSYSYDSMDRVVSQTYPDGETVVSSYNSMGNLESLGSYVSGIDYSAWGVVSAIRYGNGKETCYEYYDTGAEYDEYAQTNYSYRLRRIYTPGVMDYSYQYDRVGNVVNKWDGSRLDQYSYDAYYRLAGVTSSVYGPRSYTYDPLGNIVTKDGRNYSYAHPTKVHAVTSDGQYTYGYDANGNLVSRSDGRAYLYDAENRMISLTAGGITSSYLYDPAGERILKSDGTSSVYYFFPEYEEEVSGASTVAVSYYYANGLKVAQRRSDTGVGYIHQDHLGSSVRMSDGYGTLSFDAVYEPYGETAYQAGSASVRYRFTGQENDGATGLYYYHARYYDPELGRFIQADKIAISQEVIALSAAMNPVKKMELQEILAANPYANAFNSYVYCRNNPIIYTDPTGYEWEKYTSFNVTYTNGYGTTTTHTGEDWRYMSGGQNTTNDQVIPSPASGKAQVLESTKECGNRIRIVQDDGTIVSVFHTTKVTVKDGAIVEVGDPIAEGGSTGDNSTGPHIHVEKFKTTKPDESYYYTDKYGVRYYVDPPDIPQTVNTPLPDTTSTSPGTTDTSSDTSGDSWAEGIPVLIISQGTPPDQPQSKPKIICVELHRQGYLSDEIFAADEAFGAYLDRYFHPMIVGYQAWARPVVALMKRSENATKIVSIIAKPWSEEMAYWMGAREKGNAVGLLLMIIGLPVCGLIGLIVLYPLPIILGCWTVYLLRMKRKSPKSFGKGVNP